MNATAVVLVSVVLSAGTAAGVSYALRPAEPPPAPAAATPADLAALRAEVQTSGELLRRDLGAMLGSASATPERADAPKLAPQEVAAAVEAYLKLRAEGGAVDAAFDLDKAYADLRTVDYWENPEPWKRALAAKKMDELIERFEAAAKADPKNVAAHMELANAYLAYLQMDDTKYPLAFKADGEFDKVLELDENHWEARFSKAMSYTFWPDFLGKKKDAISHFERLVQQQESMPVQEHDAQTYLFLGNLLEQRGDSARAREAWERGLRRHPQNAELKKKVGG